MSLFVIFLSLLHGDPSKVILLVTSGDCTKLSNVTLVCVRACVCACVRVCTSDRRGEGGQPQRKLILDAFGFEVNFILRLSIFPSKHSWTVRLFCRLCLCDTMSLVYLSVFYANTNTRVSTQSWFQHFRAHIGDIASFCDV